MKNFTDLLNKLRNKFKMGILFDNKTSKYTTLLFDKKPAYLKSDTIIIIISF